MNRPILPLGLGIVGCGGAALEVVRSVAGAPGVQVVAVHDRDLDRAADLGRRAHARVHPDLAALLADPAVDAVYVALPHHLLVPMATAALRAGRHVLVEKPLAISAAGLRSVRVAARRSGRSVGVLFEHRFAPAVAAAADLARGGAIGTPRLVRIRTLIDKPPTYWDSGPTGRVPSRWRASREQAGGGVVLMNTVHQLDLVRAITGLEVDRVAAETVAGVTGVEVEDLAVATLRFRGGALGSVVASAHAPGAEAGELIEVDGSDGSLRLPDPYASPARLDLFLRRPFGGHPADRWIAISLPPVDPWAAALAAFAGAIAAGTTPVPGIDDAEAALATVLAIYRSARTGRVVPVRRSFDGPAAGAATAGRPARAPDHAAHDGGDDDA